MKYLAITLLLCFASSAYCTEKQLISAFTYHKKPPLIISQEKESGLYYDFIRYLNKHSKHYVFELIYVPRKRIERMLNSNNFNGIIIGVSPIWFNDQNEQKYLWTSRIFTDRDEVVSLKTTAIEYTSASSLTGLTFGGVRGFYYQGINQAVESGTIKRVDTTMEITLFDMLLNRRIDVAIISRTTFDYMVKIHHWQSTFNLSKQPHEIYDRRVLFPHTLPIAYQHVSEIVESMQNDEHWQVTSMQYR
ncbi:substrate-binding periplasmic protein [Thalassotalea sediminis]|uniref:substrate-binding periplasmic protein n=1 Tax=Thalassotalea sediminis TaxID=1759089 RepID=UPI002572E085|nr:transporter substrate-binding domain-containing protein [Thalassotalea sediminis]